MSQDNQDPSAENPSPGQLEESFAEGSEELFEDRLESILSTPLTPENIDNYAETAMTSLVGLVDDVRGEFEWETGITQEDGSGEELESLAFEHFGLSDIPRILDHISVVAEKIDRAGRVAENAQDIPRVIAPPGNNGEIHKTGSGDFAAHDVFPRTKTILFLLEQKMGLDIEDRTQVDVKRGKTTPDMVRKEPYIHIGVPQLNRSILVCDERGNATFVFDTRQLVESGIDADWLLDASKDELKNLIETNPNAGHKIEYRQAYVANVIRALENDFTAPRPAPEYDESVTFLNPNDNGGTFSRSALAGEFGVHDKTLSKIISGLGATLGPVEQRMWAGRLVDRLTVDQKELIRRELERQGLFAPAAGDDDESVAAFVRRVGIVRPILRRIIEENEDVIGALAVRRFGASGRPAPGLDAGQKAMLESLVAQYRRDPAEDEASLAAYANHLGVDQSVLNEAIRSLGIELHQRSRGMLVLDAEQQQTLAQHLYAQEGLVMRPPADISSVFGMSKEFGVSTRSVYTALRELGIDPKAAKRYQFGSKPATGFDAETKGAVRGILESKGYFKETPDGVLSVAGLADRLGTNSHLVTAVAEEIADQVGEVGQYRFGSNFTTGYTPAQQRLILEHLRGRSRSELDDSFLDE